MGTLAGRSAARSADHRAVSFILLAIVTTLLFRFTSRLFGPAAAAWAAASSISPRSSRSSVRGSCRTGRCSRRRWECVLPLPIILESPERPVRGGRAWGLWLAAGGLLGLALLAKYLAVFYAIGVVVFVASVPGVRRWLRHPAPYVGCLLGLAVFSPVLIWNAQNDWASFAFQGGRATNQGGMKPLFVVQMVFGAALYLAPWIWWPMVAEGVKAARPGRADRGAWFCLCVAVPTILALTIIPLWGKRGLHWPAVGFLFLLPILSGRPPGPRRGRAAPADRAGWLWFSTIAPPVVAVAPPACPLWHRDAAHPGGGEGEGSHARFDPVDAASSILIEGGVEPAARRRPRRRAWIEGGRAGRWGTTGR